MENLISYVNGVMRGKILDLGENFVEGGIEPFSTSRTTLFHNRI